MTKKAAKKGGAKGRKSVAKMSQNVPKESNKTAAWERAVFLVAQDSLSDELIAAEVGIDRRTLTRWKAEAEFKARVESLVEEIRAALKEKGIAERQNRVDALNDRWKRMQSVIEQRAKVHGDYEGGGDTGLIVKQTKGIGKGDDFQVVEEYAVDTGLLREMREHEKQAAQELGQWTEKQDVTSNGKDILTSLTVRVVKSAKPKDGSDD